MWKCPNCETINEGEACAVCGEARPMPKPQPQPQPQYAPQTQMPPAAPVYPPYYEETADYTTAVRPEKKRNNVTAVVIVCTAVIVAAIIGFGAYYIFSQSDNAKEAAESKQRYAEITEAPMEEPGDDNETLPYKESEESDMPETDEQEQSKETKSSPSPKATEKPSVSPAPTPTPKPSGKTKKQEYIDRASEIELYTSTAFDDDFTQREMNEESARIYQKWDDLLNDVYQYLKDTLPKDEFEQLKQEEIEWIKEKEDAADAEYASWQGGTIAPMQANGVLTEYTSRRCYELINMID